MRITDKSSVSLASMTDQVHWRRHCHRHLGSWHNGWTHSGFRCPSNVYGYSAPSVDYYPAPSVDDYSVLFRVQLFCASVKKPNCDGRGRKSRREVGRVRGHSLGRFSQFGKVAVLGKIIDGPVNV